MNSEAFNAAVDANDTDTVRQMANAMPGLVNPNVAEFHNSPLHRAVLNRNSEMTRVLMQLGADAHKGIWPHRDATSAYIIAKDRQYDEIVDIIDQEEARRRRELGSSGATVTAKTDNLLEAIRMRQIEEAVGMLEGDVALVGTCDAQGRTPLHLAAWTHNPELVRWLLDHGASANARDAKNKTPLDHAALVAGWSANDQFFPFLENVHVEPARFLETVQLLRERGAQLTPMAAVAIGDEQEVNRMHREGRLPNEVHFYRGGLLAIAVRVNRISMVSLLLELGMAPDESATPTDDGGESWGFPLWFASVCGRHDIAELLLTRGADVNAIVYACGDPIGNAGATGDSRMQELLLQHGARITIEHVAGSGDRETAQAILDGKMPGCSLNVEDPSPAEIAGELLWSAALNGNAEIVRMSLSHVPWSRNEATWHRILTHCKSAECMKLILDHGANPDACQDSGFTALHHLATKDMAPPERQALAALLLDAGASLNHRDLILKSTPLGWACRWGRIQLVELYLARGADSTEPDAESWATPLAWAVKREHRNIIDLLRSQGADSI